MSVTFEVDMLSQFGGDECTEVVDEVYKLHWKFREVLQRKKNEKITELETERQHTIVAKRKEEDAEQGLIAEQSSLMQEHGPVDHAVRTTFRDLNIMRRDEAPDEKYALASDIEAFNERIKGAEKAHEDANAVQTDYNNRVARWRGRMTAHTQKLQELTNRIDEIWTSLQRLRGVKVQGYDKNTGLPI